MKSFTFIVSAGESGRRLDRFLAEKLAAYSRGTIQDCIEAGRVTIDGRTVVKVSQPVAQSGKLMLSVDEHEKELIPQADIEFSVIDEQPDFLVINKPMGLVVHPGSGNRDGTLANGLVARYPEIKKVGEDPLRPGIVHRLDKETAGIMLVARTTIGYEHLKRQFKSRQIEKTYLALVEGVTKVDRGVIEGFMKRSPQVPIKRELRDDETGKFSKTIYRVLKKTADRTLVEANPQTGRMHQIRVHFASLGHPIVGDALYGRRDQAGPLGLLAWKIRFKDLGDTWREYEVPLDNRFVL